MRPGPRSLHTHLPQVRVLFGGDAPPAHAGHSIEAPSARVSPTCFNCEVQRAVWTMSPTRQVERCTLHDVLRHAYVRGERVLLPDGRARMLTGNDIRRREPRVMRSTRDSWRCRKEWAAAEEPA